MVKKEAKRFQPVLPVEQTLILPSATDIPSHKATRMVDGRP
jgi:hypothetical protein